jgi:hypothetical protein
VFSSGHAVCCSFSMLFHEKLHCSFVGTHRIQLFATCHAFGTSMDSTYLPFQGIFRFSGFLNLKIAVWCPRNLLICILVRSHLLDCEEHLLLSSSNVIFVELIRHYSILFPSTMEPQNQVLDIYGVQQFDTGHLILNA